MSAWKIDYEHDAEAIIALKKQIANQDNRSSTLENQLLKVKQSLEETKIAHNETVCKLRTEADRVVQLDKELVERKEAFDNERLSRQNAESALQNAQTQIKAGEVANRELQQALESLSSHNSGSANTLTALQREKGVLERRVRELEVNLQHVVSAATPGRPRASSNSDGRIVALERELSELRATKVQCQSDLTRANEKLGRLETELCRVENEKTTVERRLGTRVKQLEEELEERDEDLERMKGQQGEASFARAREEELMRRVEEEEAKVMAMERLMAGSRDMRTMEDALQRAERKLATEMKKAKGIEDRNVSLVRERREALDAVEVLQKQIKSLSTAVQERNSYISALDAQERDLRAQLVQAQHTFESANRPSSTTFDDGLQSADSFPYHSTPTVHFSHGATPRPHSPPVQDTVSEASVEKLLSAIERLRAERDGLRRDLEFLQLESKFTVEALEHKLASVTATTPSSSADDQTILLLRQEVGVLREQLSLAASRGEQDLAYMRADGSRLGLMASAAFVMVAHLQSCVNDSGLELQRARVDLSQARTQLENDASDSEGIVRGLREALEETQAKLQASADALSEAQHHRDDMLPQLAQLRAEVADLIQATLRARTERVELQGALQERETQLEGLGTQFEDVESERSSLSVQVVNLQNELAYAQEELAAAEERHNHLQSQQLSSMSSTQVSHALREQIEELEGRVMRRTEQIGLHQHDIRRLETNLRLQEERIGEMTGELETVMAEKASMVEDCAEAREARDQALSKVEDLEEEVEALESRVTMIEAQRCTEAATLVGIWSDAAVRSRSTRSSHSAMVREAESANAALGHQLQGVSSHYGEVVGLLDEKASALESAREDVVHAEKQASETTVALAVSQTAWTSTLRALRAEQSDKARSVTQLQAAQQEIRSRLAEIGHLQEQLESTRAHQLHESASTEAVHSAKAYELEIEICRLQQANAEGEALQAELREKLIKSAEELQLAQEQHAQATRVGDEAEQQLSRLRAEHTEELHALEERLEAADIRLQDAQTVHAELESSHAAALAALAGEKQDLEERLQQTVADWESDKQRAAELAGVQSTHEDQMREVRNGLTRSEEELRRIFRDKEKLEALHHQTMEEMSKMTVDLDKRLSESAAARGVVQQSFDMAVARHQQELAELQEQLKTLQSEADELRTRLEAEHVERMQEQTTFVVERRAAVERYESSEAIHAELRQKLSIVQAQLKDTDALYQALQDEKANFEGENTDLTAEVHRSLSMQRFLESQVKQGERDIATVKGELERAREDYGRAEAESKKAEMELDLHSARYEHALSSLRRQLETLQASPKQEETIQNLEERITEMDELMRSKTQEIEDNDDRFIQLMKEKKKLTTKVDNLTRKVQTLQAKLAATKDTPPPSLPDHMVASTSRQTPPARPFSNVSAAPPMPPMPAPVSTDVPSTPRSRFRAASGPSALPRPKTPDHRLIPPVFRAKTPEPKQVQALIFPDSMQTASSIGKKRSAPDDLDESAPVQGFTSEGVFDPDRNAESTPRVRKSFRSGLGSGFTPVRNTTARPMTTLSPVRAAIPPVISDVTNSPRSAAHAEPKMAKRGWLGKIRGGALSQPAPARLTSMTRGSVFERAPLGHSS